MSPHLPVGGLPFSFSILRTVSRSSRNSLAVEPITWDAMIEDEAGPSAQAFTSWAKSVTTGPAILRSTFTVDPQSFERAVALASGEGRRPIRGILPARSMICLLQTSFSIDRLSRFRRQPALGGPRAWSYIWLELVEIHPANFSRWSEAGTRWPPKRDIGGTQAPGGKPPRLPVTLRSNRPVERS